MSFWSELRRRNVFKVGVSYVFVAWVLAQIANVFVPALNLPDWVTRLVALLLILGFPVALVLAWAYEITPDGIKKTRPIPLGTSMREITGPRVNLVATFVLAIAVAYLMVDRFVIAPRPGLARPGTDTGAPSESRHSIAVLPFVNLSSDPEQEYFADGLSVGLMGSLARIDDLRVTARTSAFYFKGKNEDSRIIGKTLGVADVLEGTVRKDGERIRVTAELVDAESGYYLWSETYDRELGDLFMIQDDIARSVAEALSITLGVGELGRRPGMTRNVTAYEAYLRGVAIRDSSEESLRRRFVYFERAVEIDPEFALAWIQISIAYRVGALLVPDAPREEWNANATLALQRARALAPESHFIRAVEAQTTAQAWGDWVGAGRLYAAFIGSPPGDLDRDVAVLYGRFLLLAGRPSDAVTVLERAKSADPLSPDVASDLALAYESSGNLTASLAEADRGITLEGAGLRLGGTAVMTALALGDRTLVAERFELLGRADPNSIGVRIRPLLDDPAAALAELARLAREPANRNALTLSIIASWTAYFGDPSAALDILAGPAFDKENAAIVAFVVWRPFMRDVRKLPEFKNLVRAMGLVAYWREFGWSEFCRPLDADAFVCA